MEGLFSSVSNASSVALSMEAIGYWVAFSRVLGIGPVKFRLLLHHFRDDLAAAWRAGSRELMRAGLDQRIVESFLLQRTKIEPEREVQRLEQAGVSVLTWRDPSYPALLREIAGSPPVL